MSAYPLVMNHPHFTAAVVQHVGGDGKPLPGEPEPKAALFPPVIVENEDQENQHRMMGYLAAGEQLDDYVPVEYPKWVGDRLANSAEEEAAIAGQQAAETEQGAANVPSKRAKQSVDA